MLARDKIAIGPRRQFEPLGAGGYSGEDTWVEADEQQNEQLPHTFGLSFPTLGSHIQLC